MAINAVCPTLPQFSRSMKSLFRLLLTLPLLAACGPEISGSPKPPAEFGALAGKLLGCPSMQGVYAWPPVAGQYAKGFASNRAPWEGAIPLQVYPREMQIWVQQTGDKLVLRARMVNRAANVRDRMAREWGYKEYEASQYSCSGDMLEFDGVESGPAANYGGTGLVRGFKLARLKDGGIAVGIKSISTGRTDSFFSWGGQSYGSYKARDLIIWSWSKLASTGAGDKEPEPIDAYRPGATTSR